MSLLLNLLTLFDKYNELKKEIYRLEHSNCDNNNNLVLVNAIESAELEVELLQKKLECGRESLRTSSKSID